MNPKEQGSGLKAAMGSSSGVRQGGLVTLVFTDLAGSTALKQTLGDYAGVAAVQEHHALVRELLKQFSQGEEISTAGDSFFLVFVRPSDAVRFALLLQASLRKFNEGRAVPLQDRIGLHLGEVVIEQTAPGKRDLHGIQVDTCARVMSVAQAGQILMTRPVFDNARQSLKGEAIDGALSWSWLNHGRFELKGVEEPVEICEVRSLENHALAAPTTSEKARRVEPAEGEAVLGWRPAVGQLVPNTQWELERKLGEGGFGEVWLARHQKLKERRVFKFCFRADRVRSLKREMTLFRVLKEHVGDHPNIVRLLEVNFEASPFYVEEDYVESQDLGRWCETQGGVARVPLETKLEVVAQIADALQAAHDAGVIHRDVKPGNILVSTTAPKATAKLTDFGIGQVVSEEVLKGVTRFGFTQTIVADSTSSQTGSQMYMAPELLAGKPVSIRSDIYSLGVVLYQLLVSDFTQPVTGDWAKHIADPLLREDLQRCLAGKPEERFAGAGELGRQIRSLTSRRAEMERRAAEDLARERAAYRRGVIRTAGFAAVVIAGIAFLALYAFRQAGVARQQRQRADETTTRLRRNAYAADMNLAHHAYDEGNLGRVLELVRQHFPSAGEEDLRGFEWCHLWGLGQGDALRSFEPHQSAATCVAFSRDSTTLATASFDGTVRLRNVASGKEIRSYAASVPVRRNGLNFLPGGDYVAVNPGDGIVLWNLTKQDEARRLEGATVLSFRDTSPLAVSPRGDYAAAKTREGIGLWETESGAQQSIPGKDRYSGDLIAFAPDDNLLLAPDGESVSVWQIDPVSPMSQLESAGGTLASLAVSVKPTVVAAGREDGAVVLWQLGQPDRPIQFRAHRSFVFGLAFAPDGGILASGGSDQLIQLWDARSLLGANAHGGSVELNPAPEPLATLRGHGNQVWALAFSPDGKYVASASKDGEVKLWEARPKPADPGLHRAVSAVGFSLDGQKLLARHNDSRLHLWDLSSQTENAIEGIWPESPAVQDFAGSADAAIVALSRTKGNIEVWDLNARHRVDKLPQRSGEIRGLSLSGDGRVLAVTDSKGTTVWDVRSGSSLGNRPGVNAFLLSPDGTKLAGTVTKRFQVQVATVVWDVAGSADGVELCTHKINFACGAWAPNSRLFASGGHDNMVMLCDIATGRRLFELKGHLSSISSLAFTPDGKTLASGGTDGTVKLWHVATGQEMCSRRFSPTAVASLMFPPTGDALAIAYGDPSIPMRLWRVRSLKEIDATVVQAR